MIQIKKLNKAMRDCIELEIENPGWSCQQLSEAMNKHYQTVNQWLHSPVYTEERDRRLREEWNGALKMAQRNMIDLANNAKPDVRFQANKYILDSCGYEADKNVNVNANMYNYVVDYGDNDSTK